MNKKISSKTCLDFAAAVIIILIFCLNLWKVPYGFPVRDETFILSLAHRFWQGDLPVLQEWNNCQYSEILMLPIFTLIMNLKRSTEGIVIIFRFIYVILNTCTGIYLFLRTKKYGWSSIAATSIYLLYTFHQTMFPSYNTIGLMCVVVYSLLLLDPKKNDKKSFFAAGIFYAASVLCTPFLALLYFAWTVFLIIGFMIHSEKMKFRPEAWPMFTLGSVMLASIFLAYFLHGSSIGNLVKYMLLPLHSDSTHQYSGLGPLINMLALGKMLWFASKITTAVLPLYFIFFLFTMKKKKTAGKEQKRLWLLLNFIFTILLTIGYGFHAPDDYSMIALTPLGLYILLADPDADKFLCRLWFSGLAYIILINLSSDTIIGAASHASTVCAAASVLLVSQYLSHADLHFRFSPKCLLAGLCALLICFEVRDKLTVIFRDLAPSELDAEITEGPVKGILTTSEKKAEYEHQLSRIQELNLDDGKKVLFFTDQSWMYLSLQNSRYGVYSTWMKPEKEEFLTMLRQYYEEFPDQIPDAAYMPAGQNGALTDEFDQIMTSCGLTLQDNSDGLYYAKSAS